MLEGGAPAARKALQERPQHSRGSPAKVPVTVAYSPEVIAWFKATGAGWQGRMDGVLRAYVERQQKDRRPDR